MSEEINKYKYEVTKVTDRDFETEIVEWELENPQDYYEQTGVMVSYFAKRITPKQLTINTETK